MNGGHRYAVYYAPPESGALARFTASWLGWDPAVGRRVDHPDAPPLSSADIARMTRSPRRYGFHGTLKAPFRLADDRRYDDLRLRLTEIAARMPPITLPGLQLSTLGRFIALTPAGDQTLLAEFARRLVVDLDPLRAALDDAELAKRRETGLTGRQDANLRQWGYPYVMEDFRFHLTLTGALSSDDGERALAALRPLVAPFESDPFRVNEVCLFADPGNGENFRLVDRIPLTG